MTIITRIYALIDPRSGKPFYVGRTSMLLRRRLDNHVRDGKRKTTPKSQHIKQMLDAGIRPQIIELATTDSQEKLEIEALEQAWIDFYGFTYKLKNAGSSVLGGSGNNARLGMSDDMIARLGKEPDGSLAKEWGCDRKAVEYHRTKRGIARCPQLVFSTPPRFPDGPPNKINLPDWAIALLGKEPDYKIADKLGIAKTVVARCRREKGIPSFAEATGNNGCFGENRPKAKMYISPECPWCEKDGLTIVAGLGKYGQNYKCKTCEFMFSQSTLALIPDPKIRCVRCCSLRTMKNWRTKDIDSNFICRDCNRRFKIKDIELET